MHARCPFDPFLAHLDGLGGTAELELHAVVPSLGALADRVAEDAVEEEERELARAQDLPQERLDQEPPIHQRSRDVVAVPIGVFEPEPVCAVGPTRDGGLHDDLIPPPRPGERGDVRASTSRDDDGRDERDARRGEVLEVALVEVPVEDVARVAHEHAARDPGVEPRAKLLEAHEVVPRRADDDGIEGEPVDARVAPDEECESISSSSSAVTSRRSSS
jgi:hypothetical protein